MNARDLITGAGLLWLLFRKRGNGTETPQPGPETPPPSSDCWNLSPTGGCYTFGPCAVPGSPSDPAVPPGVRCGVVEPPPPVPTPSPAPTPTPTPAPGRHNCGPFPTGGSGWARAAAISVHRRCCNAHQGATGCQPGLLPIRVDSGGGGGLLPIRVDPGPGCWHPHQPVQGPRCLRWDDRTTQYSGYHCSSMPAALHNPFNAAPNYQGFPICPDQRVPARAAGTGIEGYFSSAPGPGVLSLGWTGRR